jgi:hypothetical protein
MSHRGHRGHSWISFYLCVLCELCGYIFLAFPCLGAGCDSSAAIDACIARGQAYLLSQQSPDGEWNSHVYGLFRDDPALTGHVAMSIDDRAAREKAVEYLVGRTEPTALHRAMVYPVYTAADAMQLPPTAQNRHGHDFWRGLLLDQQLDESLGWSPGDLEYGGWSYAIRPPHKPAPGRERGPWDWSNVSATRYAIEALRAEGVSPADPVCTHALLFIRRCQNADGGFFFACADELHNKAGISGRDAAGRPIFNSYGSATIDGYATLRLCGLPASDPAVIAAANWLHRFDNVDHNPGYFVPANEDIRDATYFYYCRGLAWFCADRHDRMLANRLAAALLARQRPDGSWANAFTDAKEDDPLVATPLVLEALRDCERAMR